VKDVDNAVKAVRRKARRTEKRNSVVIDTGVLVSAFAFGGIPKKAVKKAFKEADIFLSPAIIEECCDTPLKLAEREGST
jgi:hypothetical protein